MISAAPRTWIPLLMTLGACGQADPPDAYVGTWAGLCHPWEGGSTDPVQLRVTITADGDVNGRGGAAAFRDGRFTRNPSGNERLGNPDWLIVSGLDGEMVTGQQHRRMNMLVWLDDGRLMCDLTATTPDNALGMLLGVGEMRCDCTNGLQRQ